jgi:DNA-directed RNA polymerase subunit RPC12/RpoP
MQQEQNCPNCGARIIEGQQFCGTCGASFSENAINATTICPGCGTVVSPEQRYCGVCGAQLNGMEQPVTPPAPPPPPPPPPQPAKQEQPVMPPPKPVEQEKTAPDVKEVRAEPAVVTGTPAVRYGIMNFAVVLFRVIGWIILIGGCLGSIAMIVFAIIGGSFLTIIPGMDTLAGDMAVLFGIGSFVLSFIYGFAFIAFAELCRIVTRIAARVLGK